LNFDYANFKFSLDIENDGTLFVAVSGAHAYGWPSESSDLDLRIVWRPSLWQSMSLFSKPRTTNTQSNNLDITRYPLNEYLRLLAKGNGNAAENLFQVKLYVGAGRFDPIGDLQELVLNNLHDAFLKHYAGYWVSLEKDINNTSRLERYGLAKLLLQGYRVLRTGLILTKQKVFAYSLQSQQKVLKSKVQEKILGGYYQKKIPTDALQEKAMAELEVYADNLKYAIDYGVLQSESESALPVLLEEWYREQYSVT
jgi:hypothetical protein